MRDDKLSHPLLEFVGVDVTPQHLSSFAPLLGRGERRGGLNCLLGNGLGSRKLDRWLLGLLPLRVESGCQRGLHGLLALLPGLLDERGHI